MRLTVGGTKQAGGFRCPCGAEIEQLMFKVPAKLELVTEKLPLALAPGVTLTGLLVNENGCCGTWISGLFADSDEASFASPA
jgi:hypothetical protein